VLQRAETLDARAGNKVYGFASRKSPTINVTVQGVSGAGEEISYTVTAQVEPYDKSIDPGMPEHGEFVWSAELKPQKAYGGNYTIVVLNQDGDSIALANVTYGDVFFCSGQSNMALETFYTFSAEAIRAELLSLDEQSFDLRHFMFGGMGVDDRYRPSAPQWVSTVNTPAEADFMRWYKASESAKAQWYDEETQEHSMLAQFSSTCLYFGYALMKKTFEQAGEAVPIGLIQSAVGGTQIESWVSNETLAKCSNESIEAGLASVYFHGMVAPFVNYSVRGFLWYQGENNVHGVMGNSIDGFGYGCQLAELVKSWRDTWHLVSNQTVPLPFGIATLAGQGSEGSGWNMAGMRWSQTGNYGSWDNPALPFTFGAQVYDLEDPWAEVGDGNPVKNSSDPKSPNTCCFNPQCHAQDDQCLDTFNCSLPSPETGKYGKECVDWDVSGWLPSMKPLAGLIRANSPSGIKANNFMGGIHPRIKQPVGDRLATALMALLGLSQSAAKTGPTVSGCRYQPNANKRSKSVELAISFNRSLLRGEGLHLGSFESDRSKWRSPDEWGQNEEVFDSLGTMVCFTASNGTWTGRDGTQGNVSTCHCQSWNYIQLPPPKGSDDPGTFWYCEMGPDDGGLFSPPRAKIAAERARRLKEAAKCASPSLKWVPAVNPFREQWQPAPLTLDTKNQSTEAPTVEVDLKTLRSHIPSELDLQDYQVVHAIRIAWAMFDAPYVVGDTCCPAATVQTGRAACPPGSCSLYSNVTFQPANGFFAVVTKAGKCQCRKPQCCDS